jgi:hypothetical protein
MPVSTTSTPLPPTFVSAAAIFANQPRPRQLPNGGAQVTDDVLDTAYERAAAAATRVQRCTIMFNGTPFSGGAPTGPHLWFVLCMSQMPRTWRSLESHLQMNIGEGVLVGLSVLEQQLEAMVRGEDVPCMLELLGGKHERRRTTAKGPKIHVAGCQTECLLEAFDDAASFVKLDLVLVLQGRGPYGHIQEQRRRPFRLRVSAGPGTHGLVPIACRAGQARGFERVARCACQLQVDHLPLEKRSLQTGHFRDLHTDD